MVNWEIEHRHWNGRERGRSCWQNGNEQKKKKKWNEVPKCALHAWKLDVETLNLLHMMNNGGGRAAAAPATNNDDESPLDWRMYPTTHIELIDAYTIARSREREREKGTSDWFIYKLALGQLYVFLILFEWRRRVCVCGPAMAWWLCARFLWGRKTLVTFMNTFYWCCLFGCSCFV